MIDSTYRYTLTRSWTFGQGQICWTMLNPSTADDTLDDPTIRRVIRFSQDAGYRELVVVNLFAARASKPKDLAVFADPVGPHNWQHVGQAMTSSAAVVFAWGATCPRRSRQPADMAAFARRLGVEPLCLGLTAEGHPRHPLYVPAATPLEPWITGKAAA